MITVSVYPRTPGTAVVSVMFFHPNDPSPGADNRHVRLEMPYKPGTGSYALMKQVGELLCAYDWVGGGS